MSAQGEFRFRLADRLDGVDSSPVRDLLDASTAQMGLVLFGLSIGSMLGILSSGPLVMRLGTRPVVLIGSSLVVVALPTIALGASTGQPLLTAFGLALFGGGMGGGPHDLCGAHGSSSLRPRNGDADEQAVSKSIADRS